MDSPRSNQEPLTNLDVMLEEVLMNGEVCRWDLDWLHPHILEHGRVQTSVPLRYVLTTGERQIIHVTFHQVEIIILGQQLLCSQITITSYRLTASFGFTYEKVNFLQWPWSNEGRNTKLFSCRWFSPSPPPLPRSKCEENARTRTCYRNRKGGALSCISWREREERAQ